MCNGIRENSFEAKSQWRIIVSARQGSLAPLREVNRSTGKRDHPYYTLASLNDLGVSLSEDKLALLIHAQEPATEWGDFTLAEQFWLRSFQRSFLQRVEAQYFRFRNGMLDEDAWKTVRYRAWANITASASSREVWSGDRGNDYTAGFVQAIESYQPTDAGSD